MKKLMIAAAAAALVSAVNAASLTPKSLDAQAYDVNLTVKTTTCKEVKFTKKIASLLGVSSSDWAYYKDQFIGLRKQASVKIAGVIWGCECETIARPAWRLYNNGTTIGGYLFWAVGGEHPFNIFSTRFGWAVFNRIDTGDKAEGVWQLANWDRDNALAFLGAGFGKVSGGLTVGNPSSSLRSANCRVVLSSMSGNFAGFVLSGSDAAGCKLCGGTPCWAWQFCYCLNNYYDTDLTAAYGTWKIKYNKTVSKNLRKTGRITQSYNFKKAKAGDTAEIFAKVERFVARHPYFLATDDWDDEDYDEDYGEYEEEGFEVDAFDVGNVAYSTSTDEDEPNGEEYIPEEYEGENALVKALLYGDAS